MTLVIATVSLLAALLVRPCAFVWWFVIPGPRTVAIPTDADTIILTARDPEIAVEVEADPTAEIEVLVDES